MVAENPIPDGETESMNQGWLRRKTNLYWGWATEWITDTMPITADQVTLAGLAGVTTGATLRMYSAQRGDKIHGCTFLLWPSFQVDY